MDHAERRSHQRAHIISGSLPPAQITLFKPFFREASDLEMLDFSAGGMRVRSTEIIPEEFSFALEFEPIGTEVIQGEARVAHQRRLRHGYEVGIEFSVLGDRIKVLLGSIAAHYHACEQRIARGDDPVCLPGCAFHSLCSKAQRTDPPPST